MKYTICKRYSFSASHTLKSLPEGHPCARLHGHNYEVEVECQREELDANRFVVDYGTIDAVMKTVLADLDHHDLNVAMGTDQPSAEWISVHLLRHMESFHKDLSVIAIRVSETPRTWAEARR